MSELLTTVMKRDGRQVDFSVENVIRAIEKAGKETKTFDKKEAKRLAAIVQGILEKVVGVRKEPISVEHIQDIVEQVLMAAGHFKTAKAYILYRAEHAKIRKAETIIGVENDLNLSLNQLKVIERRYLLHDAAGKPTESPAHMFRRVARTLASVELRAKRKKLEDTFYEVMTKLEFLPGGRTLNNAGTPQNQLANCFVIPIEDSMEGIFDAVKWTALTHQKGGGTGFDFTPLRPRGDAITKSSGGFATGPVSFMKVFDIATRQVMQGGKQRGANMGIVSANHPDIQEFITCKNNEGEISNFNISVGASDEFMNAVEKDKEFALRNPRTQVIVQKISARLLMDQIVSLAWKTGDPGMIYWDAINRNNPLLDSVGPIYATNPCIVGTARISTDQGIIQFSELHRQFSFGNAVSKIVIDNRIKSNEIGVSIGEITTTFSRGKKDIVEITTRSGYQIQATPDHKIMTLNGWVEASKLSSKDSILLQSDEGLFSQTKTLSVPSLIHSYPKEWSQELGQVIGWLVGDGWIRSGNKDCRVGFTFGSKDSEVEKYFQPILSYWYGQDIKSVQRSKTVQHLSFHQKSFVEFFLSLGLLPVKAGEKRVPTTIFESTKEAVVGFLQGLFTSDGTVAYSKSKGTSYIRLTSKSWKLVQDVQLLLTNFGIVSSIYDRSRLKRSDVFIYTKKDGTQKSYSSDGILWELQISKSNIKRFVEKIDFLCGRHKDIINKILSTNLHKESFTDEILRVTPAGKADVYDLTETISHSFIANGIAVSNCGEQPLHPFDSCNLGSINLAAFVKDFHGKPAIDWERLTVVTKIATRMLDNVIDACKYPLPQIAQTVKQNRRIGLGVMGWADMLLHMGIAYDSEEGIKLAEKVMKHVQEQSWIASEELAKEKSPFPRWNKSWFAKGFDPVTHKYDHKKKPRKFRNVAITTIAPTGTISMAADCSSGIEPVFALCYVKNVVDAAGLTYVNKYFEEVVRKEVGDNGAFNAVVAKVAETGSARHVHELSDRLKKIFVTAHDIEWQWHVKMQAAFQKYTDNAVSKTINFPSTATLEEIRGAYVMAWKMGCKGITVYRDKSKNYQVLAVKQDATTQKEEKKDQIMQSQLRHTPLAERRDFSDLVKQEVRRGDVIDVSNEDEEKCPECDAVMQNQEGCNLCLNCGYSKCKL